MTANLDQLAAELAGAETAIDVGRITGRWHHLIEIHQTAADVTWERVDGDCAGSQGHLAGQRYASRAMLAPVPDSTGKRTPRRLR